MRLGSCGFILMMQKLAVIYALATNNTDQFQSEIFRISINYSIQKLMLANVE